MLMCGYNLRAEEARHSEFHGTCWVYASLEVANGRTAQPRVFCTRMWYTRYKESRDCCCCALQCTSLRYKGRKASLCQASQGWSTRRGTPRNASSLAPTPHTVIQHVQTSCQHQPTS